MCDEELKMAVYSGPCVAYGAVSHGALDSKLMAHGFESKFY